jgi:8-hydroxy-5-deazaflavin:NADPH oxidoreductase
MIQTIGFIGSGLIGSTLARLSIGVGLNVVMSNSRGPASLAGLIRELGNKARAATAVEAAQAGDLVVATIPLNNYKQLPAEALAGKIVIDTMNYYYQRDGRIDELEKRTLTSSEMVQRHLKGARLVKAFNNIDFIHLGNGPRPAGSSDRWALPIAGDDAHAKTEVSKLMDTIGYDAVDCGTLAESWRIEPNTPVYAHPYVGEPPAAMSKEERSLWFRKDRSAQVTADLVRKLVAQAKKSDRVGGHFEDLPPGLLD